MKLINQMAIQDSSNIIPKTIIVTVEATDDFNAEIVADNYVNFEGLTLMSMRKIDELEVGDTGVKLFTYKMVFIKDTYPWGRSDSVVLIPCN